MYTVYLTTYKSCIKAFKIMVNDVKNDANYI